MNLYCIALLVLFLGDTKNPLHPQEAEYLGTPILLTSPEQFLKAGEAYFNPTTTQIIFQAIKKPEPGDVPAEDYSMYVGTLAFDENKQISGLNNIQQISEEGSANTCGWFHPQKSSTVLFATTTIPKNEENMPGYQRESGEYRWAFPPAMNIVTCDLNNIKQKTPLITNNNHYVAEGSWSPDGRHVLYCSLSSGDGDIFVRDLQTGKSALLIDSPGYDGGPFFSPDGKRITYRSDRNQNDLLQIFIADLAFNEDGAIIGISKEIQLTNNIHVNWCPFWHPTNQFLIYTTSEIGHQNYELFICDTSPNAPAGSIANKIRITHTNGFDGLPVFSADGKILMWTSKRETNSSQLWAAPFKSSSINFQ